MEWNRNVTITTNESCNLNCIYCYEKKKSNKSFSVDNAKKQLTSILNDPNAGGVTISFHGGEPFLVFDKIKELCEWLWNQQFTQPYRCFATTNGTLIHGDIQKWLYEHRYAFICSLSLDGNRDMHNANRSDSFDLIDIPFFVKTWPNQGVKMTISPLTITTLADGIVFLHEMGVPEIRANLSEMTNWESDELLSVFQRELVKLSKYYLSHPAIKPCSLFNVPFFKILETTVPQKWCGVGEAPSYNIETNVLYPCHLFFPSVCGEEKSKAAELIDFSNPLSLISEECGSCGFLRICPTCYGANYIERNDPALRDMVLCKYHKKRFSIVADYEYKRISALFNNANDEIDKSTRIRCYKIVEGIKKIIPLLNGEMDS